MRAIVFAALAAAGLAASDLQSATAAEMDVSAERCEPGLRWNGYRCVRMPPRVAYGERVYGEQVYVEPPQAVVVAPPVYVDPYPYYAAPVVGLGLGLGFYAGPRYVWNGHRHVWRQHHNQHRWVNNQHQRQRFGHQPQRQQQHAQRHFGGRR